MLSGLCPDVSAHLLTGITVTLPSICLMIDGTNDANDVNQDRVVFEILALRTRFQGMATGAILQRHWDTEVYTHSFTC